VQDPATGHWIEVPSIGFKWNHSSIGPGTVSPRSGEHTRATLAELGLDESEIESLRAANVI